MDSFAVAPIIVCIGFCCLPNKSSKTFCKSLLALDSGWPLIANSPIDTSGCAVLLFNVSLNVVLLTKKSGTLNITSDGLSNLKPLGRLGSFNALATIVSASRSVRSLPASLALCLNTSFVLSLASMLSY